MGSILIVPQDLAVEVLEPPSAPVQEPDVQVDEPQENKELTPVVAEPPPALVIPTLSRPREDEFISLLLSIFQLFFNEKTISL